MRRTDRAPIGQRGVSLPVVLMFLVVISILATVGIRRATLGEALSRNQIDYEVARLAAEAALRDAERDLLLPTGAMQTNALCDRAADRPTDSGTITPPQFDGNCRRGQCHMGTMAYYDTSDYSASPVVNPHPWWPDDGTHGGKWGNTASSKPSDAAGVGNNCTFNGAVPLGTFTGTPRLVAVSQQPEYLIERMLRGDTTYMRITARGFGLSPGTEVVMQSYFRPYSD